MSMSGVLASAIHMVGTPGNTVAFLTSMSLSVVATSKRTRSNSSLPSCRPRSSTMVSAKMWNSGSTQMILSVPGSEMRCGSPQAL